MDLREQIVTVSRERMWSKIKAILHQLKARTQRTLEKAFAQSLEAATPDDAKAWFRSCGCDIN